MAGELLRLDRVSAGYQDIRALWDVDLTVRAGEITVLLGPNGAGKTTVLSTIAGLLRASSGRIELDGRDITRVPTHLRTRLGVGLVQENKRIFRRRTVEQNLLLGGFWRYDHRRELMDAIEVEYDRFPILRERRTRAAGTLSGGEQQMLAISQVLVAKPKILMLDEPSAGLAPEIARRVLSAVAGLRTTGLGVVLVEQVVHGPLEIADSIGVLELGRIVLLKAKSDIADIGEIERSYFGDYGPDDAARRGAS
jgi:branched-chain amino acid transport system ATP-binding protein